MEQYISAMSPDEIGFLTHQIRLNDHTVANPSGLPVLKFATTLDETNFVHLTVVYDDGLVTFFDSDTNILWANKAPIYSTNGDIVSVAFEKQSRLSQD